LLARSLFALLLFAVLVERGIAASPPPPISGGGVTGLTLQSQLEKGLRARRPVEFAYIAEIIKLVEAKKLPYKLVATTFTWAQKQPTRQLQYFQFALQTRVRAQHLKVALPDIRNQVVGTNPSGDSTPPVSPDSFFTP
jgi:hypothetical protein